MIKFTVLYPYSEGSRFDHDYYKAKHVPMAQEKMSSVRYEIERGVSGPAPGSQPAFHALVHFYFNSLDEFYAALAKGGADLGADVPNYTDVGPIIQVSEVVESWG